MESKPKTGVKKQIGWGLIGQLTYVVGQFVVLSILARFASPVDVGRFALAGAIIMPIFAFFNLGLRFNQATDTERESTFAEYVVLRSLTTTLGYLLILGIGFFFVGDESTRWILIIFGAAKAVETFSDLFYGVFQREQKMVLVARSQIARSLISSLFFSGLLIGTNSVEIAFAGHLFSWLLVAFLFDYRKAKRVSASARRVVTIKSLIAITRQSLPLGYAGFLARLTASVPRLVIDSVMGLAALGYFTVVAYALQAGTTVIMAVSHSITSPLSRYSADGKDRAFRRLLFKIIGMFTALGLMMLPIAFYLGDLLIVLFFGEQYQGLNILFTLIMAVFIVNTWSNMLQTGLIAKREFANHAINRLLLLVLMIVFTLPSAFYGELEGVALAMALAYLGQAGFLYWLLFGNQNRSGREEKGVDCV
ncbi:MAG: oligosaccharide flippase family protein [Candidatus Thiodiazotropha sp. (ex Ctena orbiculata)]|nr:oligosaccharide flippase family protein [Candidatus Thiodiazotropha taylori]MBT2998892.1 oligosaccharide flippase family protein [Candidatus Thiodiazotropha taylori]MBT3002840.1 oligosaccharide flippase family protein [Candidatus Thiodiazotropha taylori]MBV2108854.1 oligosaccharide flippase family protein [Candidatus Thiodiazotropha taylori]MBV2110777.1 oligosaccharide flippase family protein [Candidatus Thiodiazotropha taylori]